MDTQRKGLAEIANAGFSDNCFAGTLRRAGRGPERNLLDAVLNTERAACASQFDTPPAAEPERRVPPLTQQIADAPVLKSEMDAVNRYHQIVLASAEVRTFHECLHVRHVAAEIAHHAERVRQERLHVKIREAVRTRCLGGLIIELPTGEPHFVQTVDLLADLAVVNIFLRQICGRREVVVQVAAEVEIHLGSFRHHLARLSDVIGDRFFHQHMLAVLQCLHRRFIVPTAVFIPAGADINNVQFWFAINHIGEAVVCLHAEAFGCGVCAFLHNVAHCDEFG